MKRIISIVFAIMLILSLSCSVIAHDHSGNVAELDVKYEYIAEQDQLTVTINVVNITDPTGITLVEYDVHYDKSCLLLRQFKSNLPKAWQPYVESTEAEDLSRKKEDGLFTWAVMVCEPSVAIRNDNELTLTLMFEVTEEKSSDIVFEYISMANGPIELVSGNSSVVTIEFEKDKEPVIDVSDGDISVPEIPSEDESEPSSSTDTDSTPDNSNEIISGTDDFTPPQIFGDSDSSVVIESNNSESDVGNDNTGVYITVVIVALIIIAIVVICVLVLRSKGKDK